MEKRRKSFQAVSQPECMEDLEQPGENYSAYDSRKKEGSNFFRYTAVLAFFILVTIVVYSTGASTRFQSFGFTRDEEAPRFEIDIDMNKPDLQSAALKARADEQHHTKVDTIRDLNKKCQVLFPITFPTLLCYILYTVKEVFCCINIPATCTMCICMPHTLVLQYFSALVL